MGRFGERIWGIWALAAFAVGGFAAALAVAVTPGIARRRRLARAVARGIFRVTRTRIDVAGLDGLPETACIVCANHASYVDGVLMQAVLPPRFAFVVKREAARVPFVGLLLRRIGTEFVDRFNAREGAADTARLVRNSGSGNSICVFPEGTFHPERGLRRFRMGAFYAATRGNLPVVPTAITGTRDMLPAGRWLPRPGPLAVQFGDALYSTTRGRDAAHALAAAVRERIIRDCGEHCADDLG
jgi:1-acyl-sn-glycerol-3-phosphate acyltransferase